MKTIAAWLIVRKQEMTRVWHDDKLLPATLVKVCPQEVVRYKTVEKDGYSAAVVGVDKKEKNGKVSYGYMCELPVDDAFVASHAVGSSLTVADLAEIEDVRIVGISKGKGFAWVMKRHNFAGWPATHGSKFHRAGGSTGNRKPRRTIRWWKMAGRMGGDRVTLKHVTLLDTMSHEWSDIIILKGSIPGAYNDYVQVTG